MKAKYAWIKQLRIANKHFHTERRCVLVSETI